MYNELVNGAIIGAGGFLFAEVLTMPGQVFSFWRFLVEKTKAWGLFGYWANTALLDCAKCVAGTACAVTLVLDWPGVWAAAYRIIPALFVAWFLEEKT